MLVNLLDVRATVVNKAGIIIALKVYNMMKKANNNSKIIMNIMIWEVQGALRTYGMVKYV